MTIISLIAKAIQQLVNARRKKTKLTAFEWNNGIIGMMIFEGKTRKTKQIYIDLMWFQWNSM